MKLQIKVDSKKDKYKYWLLMTSFIHRLTNRQQEIMLALILKREYLMTQTNNNEQLTRELLFSDSIKKEVCKETSIPIIQFTNNIMQLFREKRAVIKIDGVYDIHPNLIPRIKNNTVIFEFKVKNDE